MPSSKESCASAAGSAAGARLNSPPKLPGFCPISPFCNAAPTFLWFSVVPANGVKFGLNDNSTSVDV